MKILYSLLIHLYGLSIHTASLFSEKARLWISGRQNLFENLQSAIRNPKSEIVNWVWFHAASLGEFEQGRPLIERIRQQHPEYKILLTFFSPSGYLVRKDYKEADYVTYMPLDTSYNAKRFIEIVKPAIAVFIKYEIWYHHLLELEKRGIPAFLISAQLREGQIYFGAFGKFLRRRLERLEQIFTQTSESAEMLRQKGFENVTIAGDTRIDRVLALASSPKDLSWLDDSLGEGITLVAGSTWPQDERRLISAVLKAGIKCIIAPHEIHEDRLRDLERHLPGAKRYSRLKHKPEKTDVVIVDTIGDLGHLYSLGHLAYVGGGFGPGIHNILEPAAYGIPVIIGPNHRKFAEAKALIGHGAVRSVRTQDEVSDSLDEFSDPQRMDAVRAAIQEYMDRQRGATERIYEVMRGFL